MSTRPGPLASAHRAEPGRGLVRGALLPFPLLFPLLLAGGAGCGAVDDRAGADVAGGDAGAGDGAGDVGPVGAPSFALTPALLSHLPEGPFAAVEGPSLVACGQGGLLPEGDSLEIRTAWCDPADVTAPLPVDVTAGTRLDLTLSHSALVADGGEAHFAVLVGDELVWEARTTLPAPAAFLAPRVALQRAHVAGEPVVVHVHNHGSNAYAIHGLRFLPP